ncbi:MAG: T9SS type A sorting domain-containing protein [Bacteroidales bacterium]|nr:T9SS type A sorting domain-containing protein [Bacteroidales bacterium]
MKRALLYFIAVLWVSPLFSQGLRITEISNLGNSSRTCNPGDTLLLSISILNQDNTPHEDCQVRLSSQDEYIQIMDSIETFDYIGAGNEYTFNNSISLLIQNVVPNGHVINLIFHLHSSETDCTQTISYVVYSCNFIVNSYNICGGVSSTLHASESDSLIFDIQNLLEQPIEDVDFHLSLEEPNISVNQGDLHVAVIPPNGHIEFLSNIQMNSQYIEGTNFNAHIEISKEGILLGTLTVPIVNFGNCIHFDSLSLPAAFSNPINQPGWYVDNTNANSGMLSLRSGSITHYDTSAVSYDFYTQNPSHISFACKVSTEDNYDWFYCYIDGVKKGQWSGNLGWEEHSFPVTSGNHNITWYYIKDISVDKYSDCIWIDDICLDPYAMEYPSVQISTQSVEVTLDHSDHTTMQVPIAIRNMTNTLPVLFSADLCDEENNPVGWASISPMTDFINAQQQKEINLEFHAEEFPFGDYQAQLHITFEDITSTYHIPILMHIESGDGVESFTSDKRFSILPNPTTGKVTIAHDYDYIQQLFIYDAQGKQLESLSIQDIKADLDLSQYHSGLYFIQIRTDEGLYTQKLIKH